jgi:hypothetical protein
MKGPAQANSSPRRPHGLRLKYVLERQSPGGCVVQIYCNRSALDGAFRILLAWLHKNLG